MIFFLINKEKKETMQKKKMFTFKCWSTMVILETVRNPIFVLQRSQLRATIFNVLSGGVISPQIRIIFTINSKPLGIFYTPPPPNEKYAGQNIFRMLQADFIGGGDNLPILSKKIRLHFDKPGLRNFGQIKMKNQQYLWICTYLKFFKILKLIFILFFL